MSETQNTFLHTVLDVLTLIKKGMLLFLVTEYYELSHEDIIGVSGKKHPKVSFTKQGFLKILSKNNEPCLLEKNIRNRTVKINDLNHVLQALSSQKILAKFPYFFSIIDENLYNNTAAYINDNELVNRCQNMQSMWKDWGQIGLAQITASHQALQRMVAAKMKQPLASDFDRDFKKNGLSTEYQCEIYANHLYGARLSNIWHAYLMSMEPENRPPQKFMEWLKTQPPGELQKYEIENLNEISEVNYMVDSTQRMPWLLYFKPGNIVEGNNIPKPTEEGVELKIIYALGQLEHNLAFFGGPKKRGTINHSSFFGGEPTHGAGYMFLRCESDTQNNLCWVLHKMDNNSGHIKPNDKMTLQTLEQLENLDLDLNTIAWSSKYGSIGQRDERVAMALKRLKQDCSYVKVLESKNSTPSKRIDKIAQFSNNGAIKELNLYLAVRIYKITVEEASTVALLIKQTLQNHLALFEQGTLVCKENYQNARKLINHAIKLLKNTAINSSEFEIESEKIINEYKNNISCKNYFI